MAKQTTNYDQFLPNPIQRKYRPLKANDLIRRMQSFGFPESMAISVYRENGRFYINSGHHRLAAAKKLKLPVWYVVEPKWTTEALVSEGGASTNWQYHDVASAWSNDGRADYTVALAYAAKGIPLILVVSLLGGECSARPNKSAAFKDGRFEVKDTSAVDCLVHALEQLSEDYPAASSMNFLAAISALLLVDDFSLSRMVLKIKTHGKLNKTSTRNEMLAQLELIYNCRSKTRENIAFRALEALRSRSAVSPKTGGRARQTRSRIIWT